MNRFFLTGIVLIAITGCKYDKYEELYPSGTIRLRWNKAYESETPDKVKTGLLWTFHILGARIDKGSFDKAVYWSSPNELEVHIDALGFSQQGLNAFNQIIKKIKDSEEYEVTEAIDAGRFIMLTLNSSNHYYKITGVPATLDEYREGRDFDTTHVDLINSTVSLHHRIIEFGKHEPFSISNTCFIAREGHGAIDSGTFTHEESEVLDMMPNGHFRYGIYDQNGNLVTAVKPELSLGGKPAKCLWCHESTIQTVFAAPSKVSGYYSSDSFNSIINDLLLGVNQYRNSLNSDLDFNKKQDHTMMELLYISFSEPSAERLAIEWSMPMTEVLKKLQGLPTHTHIEFSFLGTLYDREDVEKVAPWKGLRAPSNAREKSDYEPNLIP